MNAQELVGGPQPFERFLKAYIHAKRFAVHTSEDLRDFFCEFFQDVPAIQAVDWDAWLSSPGQQELLGYTTIASPEYRTENGAWHEVGNAF